MAIFQKFAVVEAGIEISIGQTYCSYLSTHRSIPKNRGGRKDEINVLPRARDGCQRPDVGDEIGVEGAARDEPDGACGAALDVHGHHRLGAGVPHDDLHLALRAKQLDIGVRPSMQIRAGTGSGASGG